MNYADIKYCDVANGPGVRVSLFVSGCTRRCPGCFNQEAWDFHYGNLFTEQVEEQIMQWLGMILVAALRTFPFQPVVYNNLAVKAADMAVVGAGERERNHYELCGYKIL